MKNIRHCIMLILTMLALLISSPAMSQEVAIKDIVITNSSSDLLLYLNVVNAFTPEMVEGVENGLPATFTFQVILTMVRSGWPDKEIYSGSINHTLTYDNLKKEYSVTVGEHENKPLVTTDLGLAKAAMADLNGMKLLPLAKLSPDREYVLEVRAILAKKTLPFYFHYLIPFGGFGDFDTDWHSVEFRY